MPDEPIDYRRNWQPNDDGTLVPRRTAGTVAEGDFTLVCTRCGDEYGNEPELPVGVIAAHFAQRHPETIADGQPKVELTLLWLGQGPAPEPRQ